MHNLLRLEQILYNTSGIIVHMIFLIIIALPNILADLLAFLGALKIEKLYQKQYAHFWQRALLGLIVFFVAQFLLFLAFDYILRYGLTSLLEDSDGALYDGVTSVTAPFTSILYLLSPVFLIGVYLNRRLRLLKSSVVLPVRSTKSALFILVLTIALVLLMLTPILWQNYQNVQHHKKTDEWVRSFLATSTPTSLATSTSRAIPIKSDNKLLQLTLPSDTYNQMKSLQYALTSYALYHRKYPSTFVQLLADANVSKQFNLTQITFDQFFYSTTEGGDNFMLCTVIKGNAANLNQCVTAASSPL